MRHVYNTEYSIQSIVYIIHYALLSIVSIICSMHYRRHISSVTNLRHPHHRRRPS